MISLHVHAVAVVKLEESSLEWLKTNKQHGAIRDIDFWLPPKSQQHDTITNHHQELIIWYHMPSSHHQQDAHKTKNPMSAQISPIVRINTLIHLISLPRLSLTRVSPRPITLSYQTLLVSGDD